MSGAFDHWMNALNAVLQHGEAKEAERVAAREERKASRTQRAFGSDKPSVRVPSDPSCCLAKRRFDK